MILKASQRGGAKQLGLHLLKTEENEHVELHQIRGFVSSDIVGAFKESYAVSRGTKCKQFLFSVSLNPPQTENVGVDIFVNAADRIEEKTGLTGQPRVIVFHEKEGRRHAHVVWSRIDADTMTAINLPFFKNRLRELSRELYMENDWTMPRGLMDSEARDPRNYDLAEYQQAKRMGVNARDLKAEMQDCWAVSDSKGAFEQALSERGMMLAKGDRRGHVAVTHDGEVLSIARYVGKKAKDVVAKLGEPDGLSSVDDAKLRMAQDMTHAFNRHADEARDNHTAKAAELEEQRLGLTADHKAERLKLDAAQQLRQADETRARQERFNAGMRGLWDRLTGQHTKLRKQNELESYAALKRDREQRDAIVAAQLEERRALQAEILRERQENTKLLTQLSRDRQPYEQEISALAPERDIGTELEDRARSPMQDQFDRVAALREPHHEPDAAPAPTPDTPPQPPIQPSHEDRLKALRDNQPKQNPDHDRGPEIER
tara:strand:+ start:2737 stop:4200 length:1464 start_codon:yes stop_codon:yes gene_type:complete